MYYLLKTVALLADIKDCYSLGSALVFVSAGANYVLDGVAVQPIYEVAFPLSLALLDLCINTVTT